jgi:hypothetical protein
MRRVNLQLSLPRVTDTVNMPTLKQKFKRKDAIKCPLFDLRHFCARARAPTHTYTHTGQSRLAAGAVCYTRRLFSWKQNFKILVDSEKLAAWKLITFMAMDSLT